MSYKTVVNTSSQLKQKLRTRTLPSLISAASKAPFEDVDRAETACQKFPVGFGTTSRDITPPLYEDRCSLLAAKGTSGMFLRWNTNHVRCAGASWPRGASALSASSLALIAMIACCTGAAAQTTRPTPIERIEVYATSPVPGSEIDIAKIPSNAQTLSANDFDHATAPSLLDSLLRGLPGVSLSDQTGNAFQRDLDYRGFTASPVIGTPQGIAVYQNGVRANEVFGDTVNWDLIPENAINRFTLLPNNPCLVSMHSAAP